MPTIRLADRALLTVKGPDAAHFLQNILTTDLDRLDEEVANAGALLTPQGKILFDFLVSRTADGFRLDCRADIAEDFRKRLILYRLRAKAEIALSEQPLVAAAWGSDSGGSETESSRTDRGVYRDGRFPDGAAVRRIYGRTDATDDAKAYARLRIRYGIAESGIDYALGDAFPHDVLLDQIGGVGFRKGCYVGQEVVSRMQHRGTARRRVLIASADSPLPSTGTEVTAAGRPLGVLGTVSGREGLAIVRIDRVKDALDTGTPILAGEMALTLAIPGWATFTFPTTEGSPA